MYGESYRVTSSALYDCYLRWCEDNALNALKRESFVTWLRQNEGDFHIKYSYHIQSEGKHVRGFTGIAVNYSTTAY